MFLYNMALSFDFIHLPIQVFLKHLKLIDDVNQAATAGWQPRTFDIAHNAG
jgi:hypothetical protein